MDEVGPPVRPPGEPKPLIEEDIAPVLARLDAWYAAHLPPDQHRLNPPATEAQLAAFEQLVGRTMPRAFHQLYQWHDGEQDGSWGYVYGLQLLPLEQVAFQWTSWNEVLADFDGDRYAIPGGGWPQGAVDPAYINPGWIPLTHDWGGNHIGLDLDPWPEGRIGQVILFGRDEEVKAVFAPSLGGFLEWIAGLLESGNFILDTDPETGRLSDMRLKEPESTHFHDEARVLLGAAGPYLFG